MSLRMVMIRSGTLIGVFAGVLLVMLLLSSKPYTFYTTTDNFTPFEEMEPASDLTIVSITPYQDKYLIEWKGSIPIWAKEGHVTEAIGTVGFFGTLVAVVGISLVAAYAWRKGLTSAKKDDKENRREHGN